MDITAAASTTQETNHPGATFYALNNADRLTSDEQVNRLLAEIQNVGPDAFIISEAFSAMQGLSPSIESKLRKGLAEMGYGFELATVPYAERRSGERPREDEHIYIAGAKIELGAKLGIIRFAGRWAVHMAFFDPQTVRRIEAIGMHVNDDPPRRAEEIRALSLYFGGLSRDQPFVFFGDLNNSENRGLFATSLRVARGLAQIGIRFGLIKSPELGTRNQPALTRLASLAIRGASQVDGKEIAQLHAMGLLEADPHQLPTSLVPGLPRGLDRILRCMPFVREWLERPHIQADHILGTPAGSFVRFERRPVLPGGDHAGIVATYQLSKASVKRPVGS